MATKPSAARHFLVSVSGIPGFWAQKRGGDTSVVTTKVYDGGSDRPEVLTDPTDFDNITLVRPWRRDRDAALAKQLRPVVGRREFTITQQPTDEDYVRSQAATRYTGVLVRVRDPESDAGASAAAEFQLEFAIRDAV